MMGLKSRSSMDAMGYVALYLTPHYVSSLTSRVQGILSSLTPPTIPKSLAQQDKENMLGEELNTDGKRELSKLNQSVLNKTDEGPSLTNNTLLGNNFIRI